MMWMTGALLSILAKPATYLDPGSGSFLLQLLIAGLAAVGIVFASQWRRIKRFFSRKKDADEADDEDDDQEPGA